MLATNRDLEGLSAALYLYAQDRESFERLSLNTITWCFWNADGSVKTKAYQMLGYVHVLGPDLERGVAAYVASSHRNPESSWDALPGDCDAKIRILSDVIDRSPDATLTAWCIDQLRNQLAMDPDDVTKHVGIAALRRLTYCNHRDLQERASQVLQQLDSRREK